MHEADGALWMESTGMLVAGFSHKIPLNHRAGIARRIYACRVLLRNRTMETVPKHNPCLASPYPIASDLIYIDLIPRVEADRTTRETFGLTPVGPRRPTASRGAMYLPHHAVGAGQGVWQ